MEKLINLIENASPRDKILSYLTSSRKGDVYLSASEMEYMEQIDYVDDIIRNHRNMRDKEYINMITEKYGISLSKARNLLLDCKYIHGSTTKPVKTYERSIMTDCLWELYTKAKGNGEIKHAIAALELIAKINGYDQADEEQVNEDESRVVIIRPVFKPEILGVPNPDNLDELVFSMRKRIAIHKKASESLPEND